jgi:hypothetical protein
MVVLRIFRDVKPSRKMHKFGYFNDIFLIWSSDMRVLEFDYG